MELQITITHELSPSAFQLLKQLVERTVVASDNSFMVAKPDGTPVPIVSAPEPVKPKRAPRKPKAEAQPEQNVAAPAVTPPTTPVLVVTPAPAPSTPPPPKPAAAAPTLTLDDVARSVSAVLPRVGMDGLRSALAKFKLQHVVKLKPEQFGPFLAELQEVAKTVGAQPTKAAQ